MLAVAKTSPPNGLTAWVVRSHTKIGGAGIRMSYIPHQPFQRPFGNPSQKSNGTIQSFCHFGLVFVKPIGFPPSEKYRDYIFFKGSFKIWTGVVGVVPPLSLLAHSLSPMLRAHSIIHGATARDRLCRVQYL